MAPQIPLVKHHSDPVPVPDVHFGNWNGNERPRRRVVYFRELKPLGGRISSIVESGGVLGLTGNYFGRRQRVEGHPLVKRVKATLTADNNYALAA